MSDRSGLPMRYGPSFCPKCQFAHPGECAEPWKFDARMFDPPPPSDKEMLAIYRDIFAEITAKAKPYGEDVDDPERVVNYIIPCGPIHRAAGKLGFQMFNGEKYLADAIARIAELEAQIEAMTHPRSPR
jgi:hypothetical protein